MHDARDEEDKRLLRSPIRVSDGSFSADTEVMRLATDRTLRLSPSDLANYLAWPHLTQFKT
jgi:hypothetical protein